MRRRLLVWTLLVTLVAVVLFGVPLGIVGARVARDSANKRVTAEAQQIASLTRDGLVTDQPITAGGLARLAQPNRYVVLTLGDGQQVTSGTPIKGATLRGTALASEASTVVVYAPDDDVTEQVRNVWLLVGALAVLAMVVAAVLAMVQARRLVRPLVALAGAADRLGSTEPEPRGVRYHVRELDNIAEILDRSAVRIARMLRRERDFAADASHQLRTPLTALSIRLEEILEVSDRPAVHEEATAALAQVERLTAVVQSLLTQARTSRAASAVLLDVEAVIRQQVVEWTPAFRQDGRRIRTVGAPGQRAFATPVSLSQVLSSLLDNALVHGAGTVTVGSRYSGGHVVIEVSDEGVGVPPELGQRVFERSVSGRDGTGLGLALARDVIESDGGRLELVRPRPAAFAIFLTAAPEQCAQSDAGTDSVTSAAGTSVNTQRR